MRIQWNRLSYCSVTICAVRSALRTTLRAKLRRANEISALRTAH